MKLPVKAVATSIPFLVLLWAHFANMWGIYFIATNGPKYTLEVLGFNMKSVILFNLLLLLLLYISLELFSYKIS